MENNLLCNVSLLGEKQFIAEAISHLPISCALRKTQHRVFLAPRRTGKTSLIIKYIKCLIKIAFNRRFCITVVTYNSRLFVSQLHNVLRDQQIPFVISRKLYGLMAVSVGDILIFVLDENIKTDLQSHMNAIRPDIIMIDEANIITDDLLYFYFSYCNMQKISFYAFGSNKSSTDVSKKSMWIWLLNHPDVCVEKAIFTLEHQIKILAEAKNFMTDNQILNELLIDQEILHRAIEKEKRNQIAKTVNRAIPRFY